MLGLPSDLKVWVASQAVDMRKGCLSLAALIEKEFKLSAKSGQLFVFFGRNKAKVKIVYWDRNGFSMWYKTLAAGCFRPPRVAKQCYALSLADLTLLLEGIDLNAKRLSVV
jgi:transposase